MKNGVLLEALIKQLCERYGCKYTTKISQEHLTMLDADLEQIITDYFESK